MINPIKVYSVKDHSPTQDWVNHLIHPLRAYWGDGTVNWPKWESEFKFYKKYFVITHDINDCEVGFAPLSLNYYLENNVFNKLDQLANRLDEFGKKLYIWVEGDNEIFYQKSNCIFIKYFGYKSKSDNYEIIQPGDLKTDLLHYYFSGKLQLRNKTKVPVVGFDGIATYPYHKILFGMLKNTINKIFFILSLTKVMNNPVIPSLIKRKLHLNKLKDTTKIKSNFTLRNSFASGTRGGNKKNRQEFINNIISSDYTFCYRGAGNYSLRLYETLCLGRIPIFINTDCILPFEDEIDWKILCLWVEEGDMDKIGQIVLDFHSSMSNDEFIERQIKCREIWKKFLSKEGFAKELNMLITKNIMDKKSRC